MIRLIFIEPFIRQIQGSIGQIHGRIVIRPVFIQPFIRQIEGSIGQIYGRIRLQFAVCNAFDQRFAAARAYLPATLGNFDSAIRAGTHVSTLPRLTRTMPNSAVPSAG